MLGFLMSSPSRSSKSKSDTYRRQRPQKTGGGGEEVGSGAAKIGGGRVLPLGVAQRPGEVRGREGEGQLRKPL